jgi:hypothetical protein
VKLDFLEALLRPVEQLDKRTPRGKSRLGADYHGRMIDQFEAFASGWVGAHYDDLLNIKNNWMKNISGERLLFMKYVLYFTLRAIQRMFKFFPEEFVVTLFLAAD